MRLVGIDPAWGALLGEWLREAGYRVEGLEECPQADLAGRPPRGYEQSGKAPFAHERPQADDMRRPPPEGVQQSGKATFAGEIEALPMSQAPCALVLLGLAFPRRDGPRQVQRVRQCWPAVPLVLASPTFHQGVEAQGPLARELGVAAILALPVTRTELLAVVNRTTAPPP